MFDIVIPVGPNEENIIYEQIKYTKQNIIGYRNIFIITPLKGIVLENCTIIDERIFPFSLETIAQIHGRNFRNGWYLQQLLKLYAGIIIPDILEKYLVIDGDTFFLKPIKFIEEGKCLYNFGSEYHKPYFNHMVKLDNSLTRQIEEKSGICHHMIFETKYIKEIFKKIEEQHQDTFYNIFLKMVDPQHILYSGASEYEIYFNYMLLNYPNEIIIRELKWKNNNTLIINEDYDYISVHYLNRKY